MKGAILELCCEADSGLGTAAPDFGFSSGRITIAERLDLPRGVAAALRFVAEHPGLDVWCSLPCTDWCSWNRLNAARLGGGFRAGLAYRRRKSLKMVAVAERVMLAALASGGRAHFEWPRHCDGWRARRVQAMIRRLSMIVADFDGCCFDVLAGPGLLARKPWRLATTSPALATALSAQRCPGGHPHGQLSGKYALRSGHYTPSLCRFVLRRLAGEHPPGRAAAADALPDKGSVTFGVAAEIFEFEVEPGASLRPVPRTDRRSKQLKLAAAQAYLLRSAGCSGKCVRATDYAIPQLERVKHSDQDILTTGYSDEVHDPACAPGPYSRHQLLLVRDHVALRHARCPHDLPAGFPVLGSITSVSSDEVLKMKGCETVTLETSDQSSSECGDRVRGVDVLLDGLAKAVFGDAGALGEVARSLRDGTPRKTRQRDLFPLPLSTCRSDFARAVVAVLNFLYGVRAPVLVPRRVSAAQQAALDNIDACLQEFTVRLLACPAGSLDLDGWEAFEPDAGEERLELDAARVDCPERAGTCDPLPLLPDEVRAKLLDPEALFSEAPPGLERFPGFYAGRPTEYHKLIVRQLRCGKLSLAESVRGGGTVFPVGKSSGNQREVWHGSRVSEAAAHPPRPAHLASPTAFRAIELGLDEVLRVSKRDGRCFFDQLLLPECLKEFMGRPAVSVSQLVDAGLSDAELRAALPASSTSVPTWLWPVSCVWGMGFSWSSYVAQTTLLAVCASAGLGPECVLSTDGPAPRSFDRAFSLATDDVMLFSTAGEGVTVDMSERLEAAFKDHGIVKHPEKDEDDVTDGECVGVELVGGRWWWPPAPRMWSLLRAVRGLLAVRTASPAGVRAFLGTLQWYDLLERTKLAVYDEVYAFAASEPEAERRCVPTSCLCELLCGVVLGPFWGFDMRRPHQPLVVASDASTSFGLGVSVAELDVDRVRELARLDTKAGDHVVLGGGSLEPDKDRLGQPHHLGLSMSDFTTVLSIRAPKEHINIMEGKAFLAALRWVLRRPDRHRRRLVVLIDSRVWIGAAAKGRSSSVPLLRLCRRVAALVLASGVVVHYVYIPSKHNPADAPSRGVRPRWRPAARGLRARSKLERHIAASRYVLRVDSIGNEEAHDDAVSALGADLSRCRHVILRGASRHDLDGSGLVSVRCLRRLLTRLVQHAGLRGRLESLFAASDAVHGCLVDYRAFVDFLVRSRRVRFDVPDASSSDESTASSTSTSTFSFQSY